MARDAVDGTFSDRGSVRRTKPSQPTLDHSLPSSIPEDALYDDSHSSHRSARSYSHSEAQSPNGDSDSEDDRGLRIARPAHTFPTARPSLARSQTDDGSSSGQRRRRPGDRGNGVKGDHQVTIRHGWESQLMNEEVTRNLSENFFMYYEDKRHDTAGNLSPESHPKNILVEWRMKDRLKTVSALLAVCLNVGVDPPDVVKTNPCARLECWIDPIPPDGNSSNNNNAQNNSNAQIGKNLQGQYENLSVRTRYKVIMDPTIEELKKYATSLRRMSHGDRLLFHYNGHGVPKPTQSGEVWCFNRSYTQYIPISLFELQDWAGAPGLWVWDCSAAGGIINGFLDGVQKHSQSQKEAFLRDPNRGQQQPMIKWEDCIHLAACRVNEVLPTNPQLPADMFTSCLTTPIMMAVRFFILQNPIRSTSHISLDLARNIPGKVSERRTPLGELNWIFTAITDSIAWTCLDKPLFKKLFRQDLMVAALFRNFLLAQRVMRIYHCHPQSYPVIPDTHDHPLWKSWDLAVETILTQLPSLIEQQKANESMLGEQAQENPQTQQPELEYVHSDFFADQLSAFEVYLQSAPSNPGTVGYAKPPEQLPIVLQVLLSQVHRLRALVLLSKFLDLGPWAVNLALSIGIFPYVLKLLQSQAFELKAPMVFIWARILAVDQSCQGDLLKDSGFSYFTSILSSTTGIPIGNIPEHRAMCTFVIAMFCKDFKPGKQAALESNPELIEHCLNHLHDMENPLLRQFSLLCLSNLCRDFPHAKEAIRASRAQARIRDCSHDPVPEVRVACIHALTSYIATGELTADLEEVGRNDEEALVGVVLPMGMDGSIMVRKELTIFYSELVKRYEARFLVAAWEQLVEERDKKLGKLIDPDDFLVMALDGERVASTDGFSASGGANGVHTGHTRSATIASSAALHNAHARNKRKQQSRGTIYRAVWRQLLSLSTDPHPEVSRNASIVVDYVVHAMLESALGDDANAILDQLVEPTAKDGLTVVIPDRQSRQANRDSRPDTPPSPAPSTMSKAEGYFGLSRTASVAGALKSLIGLSSKTPGETPAPISPVEKRRGSSISERPPYRSRPLAPADAAVLPPDALDTITGPPHQAKAMVPSTPHFKPRDLSEMPILPLKSDFFEWSASYFREPQMRPAEADEPGSKDYNERLWRRNRNDKIIASTQPMKEAAGSQRWDVPCGYFGIGAAPAKMVFHQFENHLITSDDRDSIAVWDWKEQKQLARFSNGNPAGSRVTELKFINEDDTAMLMTGSSEGVIRVYRHYEDLKRIQLVSSFRALNDLVPSDQQSAGLVFDWQQGQGKALVAGDDRVIRVWHVGQEMCIGDIPARSGSCITTLTSDQVEGNVFVAGFGNGSLRAYDQRLPRQSTMIMDWVDKAGGDHRSWIVGAHLQRGGQRELISAESNGGIRLWDIRMRRAVASRCDENGTSTSSSTHAPGGGHAISVPGAARSLRALSVHEHAPVFATGGRDHTIRVYDTGSLRLLSSFEPYMSWVRLAGAPRLAPITATAFHPHRMMLACGAVNDGHVNLFKCDVASAEQERLAVVEDWKF